MSERREVEMEAKRAGSLVGAQNSCREFSQEAHIVGHGGWGQIIKGLGGPGRGDTE